MAEIGEIYDFRRAPSTFYANPKCWIFNAAPQLSSCPMPRRRYKLQVKFMQHIALQTFQRSPIPQFSLFAQQSSADFISLSRNNVCSRSALGVDFVTGASRVVLKRESEHVHADSQVRRREQRRRISGECCRTLRRLARSLRFVKFDGYCSWLSVTLSDLYN